MLVVTVCDIKPKITDRYSITTILYAVTQLGSLGPIIIQVFITNYFLFILTT